MNERRGTKRKRKRALLAISMICMSTAILIRVNQDKEVPETSSVNIEQSQENSTEQSNSNSLAESLKPQEGEHPLDPLLELATSIRDKLKNEVQDYTATLVKRERVRGSLLPEERMQLKLRNPTDKNGKSVPLSCYLKFEAPKSAQGREVIWIEGQNDNKLAIHEGGLKNLLRLNLAPDNILVSRNSKYPITEIGLLKLSEKLIEKGNRDRALGSCEVNVLPNQLVGAHKCQLIEIKHPKKQEGFDFHIARIYLDDELGLPIRYAAYMWPENTGDEPPLEEEYTYLDLSLNVGLTDADFDPDNPDYDYP